MSITGIIRYAHKLGVTVSVRAGEQLVKFAGQTLGPFPAYDIEATTQAMQHTGIVEVILAAYDWIQICTKDVDKTTRSPWKWLTNSKRAIGSPAEEEDTEDD